MTGVAVTAAVAHVPGLPAELDLPPSGAGGEPAVDADQAHQLLGRKGLLYKEPATRLALCAVHRALGLPPGRPERDPAGAGTAVVVSSNLGNAATVCTVVDQVRAGQGREVSPLQAPNASSNVIASTIAIRHGFTGANLTVCSGATGGLDAVRLGALLVRSGRARRAVVVGVEPADEVAVRLLALRGATAPRAVAAAVVLEPAAGPGAAGGAVELGPVRRHAGPVPPVPPDPARAAPAFTVLPHAVPGAAGVDLTGLVGDCYGAAGVLAVALAARWLAANAGAPASAGAGTGVGAPVGAPVGTVAITCGDAADGYASTWLSRA